MTESENGQPTEDGLERAPQQTLLERLHDEGPPAPAQPPTDGATGEGDLGELTTLEVYGVANRLYNSALRVKTIAAAVETTMELAHTSPSAVLRDMLDALDAEMDRLRDIRGRIWDALEGRP